MSAATSIWPTTGANDHVQYPGLAAAADANARTLLVSGGYFAAEVLCAVHPRPGLTLAAIADGLNRDAVPTAQGGARWWPRTVSKILAAA
jgi:hypothetical protein